MLLKIENLAPTKIINIYLPQNILPQNKAFVLNRGLHSQHEFLNNLCLIEGIERVLITDNMISCKYFGSEADDIKSLLMAEIDDYLAQTNTLLTEDFSCDLYNLAEALADALIRPTLNRDNGDIKIISVEKDTLTLTFTGHCAGCPYAQNTLKNVIERVFLRYIPQLKKIVLQE